jgi:hypothetical protein
MYNFLKSIFLSKAFLTPLIAFLLGCSLTFYWTKKHSKPVIQTEVVEKIVEKERVVFQEKKDTKINQLENKNIETRIIEKPDGTKETIITDKSTTKTDSQIKEQTELTVDKSKETKKETHITQNPPANFMIGVSGHLKSSDILNLSKESLTYQGEVSYRLLGPIWSSAFYSSDHKAGIGLSLEF